MSQVLSYVDPSWRMVAPLRFPWENDNWARREAGKRGRGRDEAWKFSTENCSWAWKLAWNCKLHGQFFYFLSLLPSMLCGWEEHQLLYKGDCQVGAWHWRTWVPSLALPFVSWEAAEESLSLSVFICTMEIVTIVISTNRVPWRTNRDNA